MKLKKIHNNKKYDKNCRIHEDCQDNTDNTDHTGNTGNTDNTDNTDYQVDDTNN
jgi:hypothetical protein